MSCYELCYVMSYYLLLYTTLERVNIRKRKEREKNE